MLSVIKKADISNRFTTKNQRVLKIREYPKNKQVTLVKVGEKIMIPNLLLMRMLFCVRFLNIKFKGSRH